MTECTCECGHKHEQIEVAKYHCLMRYEMQEEFYVTTRNYEQAADARAYGEGLSEGHVVGVLKLTHAQFVSFAKALDGQHA
jgi:hypothetical protein